MVDYAGRKILVTGGTGFIGGRLAERLAVEEQARVRVLVHHWSKATWVSRADVKLVQGDIRDPHSVAQAMRGCELVFHCAAVGGTLDQCMSINCEGTRNVLESAMNARVERVVYLSTIAVHGPDLPDQADENDEFRPSGPYGDSKIDAEKIIWQFWRERRLPLVIIRPAPVWGPRAASFTLWPLNCMKSGQWFLIDSGQGTCNAVYIDNLVDALLLAGVKPGAVGEAFLITDGRPCTWAEFFGHYARMLGVQKLPSIRSDVARFASPVVGKINGLLSRLDHTPAYEPARTSKRALRWGLRLIPRLLFPYGSLDSWDLRKYACRAELNVSKARAVLGYSPPICLEEGMRETEAWLRDQRII